MVWLIALQANGSNPGPPSPDPKPKDTLPLDTSTATLPIIPATTTGLSKEDLKQALQDVCDQMQQQSHTHQQTLKKLRAELKAARDECEHRLSLLLKLLDIFKSEGIHCAQIPSYLLLLQRDTGLLLIAMGAHAAVKKLKHEKEASDTLGKTLAAQAEKDKR